MKVCPQGFSPCARCHQARSSICEEVITTNQARRQSERAAQAEADALKVCAIAEALEALRTVEADLRSWLQFPGLMGSKKEAEMGQRLGSIELVNRQAERSGITRQAIDDLQTLKIEAGS